MARVRCGKTTGAREDNKKGKTASSGGFSLLHKENYSALFAAKHSLQ